MSISRFWSGAFLASALIGAASAPAFAEGAGLVLEVSGKTQPPVASFAEVAADQSVTLADGGKLKIVHYKSCRAVTLTGGTLKIGAADFDISAAKVASDQPNACPRRTAARTPRAGDAGTGGIVVRGAPPVTANSKAAAAFAPKHGGSVIVSPAETFVFVGHRVGEVKTMRLVRDEKILAEWQPGKAHSWTAPKNALKEGDAATLTFVMKDGQSPVEQAIKVLHDEGNGPKVTVIQLD